MSLELLLIFTIEKAPTSAEWGKALAEQNVPVEIAEQVDLTKHSGFLPMKVQGKDSGLYFLVGDYSELTGQVPKLRESGLEEAVVYSLGYGGDFFEGAAVFFSASALVASFDGRAFEPQGGVFMDSAQLMNAGKQLLDLAGEQ